MKKLSKSDFLNVRLEVPTKKKLNVILRQKKLNASQWIREAIYKFVEGDSKAKSGKEEIAHKT